MGASTWCIGCVFTSLQIIKHDQTVSISKIITSPRSTNWHKKCSFVVGNQNWVLSFGYVSSMKYPGMLGHQAGVWCLLKTSVNLIPVL